MTATQSDGIKQMQNGDPIWERIRSETREAAAAEPILASFLHATIPVSYTHLRAHET